MKTRRGRERGRGEGEPPLDDEEDDRDPDDREQVLEEEDEPVAEEEAHRLQVDRRPGHQLAGLVPVVEAEGEPEELRVDLVAHVVLDAERLPTREEASPGHEDGPCGADEQDGERDRPELAPALRVDRALERVAGEEGDGDRRGLGGDGEHDRHGQRPPIRPQKAEQADERAQIWGAISPPEISTSSVGPAIPCPRWGAFVSSSDAAAARIRPERLRRARRGDVLASFAPPSRRRRGSSTCTPIGITIARCSRSSEAGRSWSQTLVRRDRGRGRADRPREHEGAHPRIGAADVVPLVPLEPEAEPDGARGGARARGSGRRRSSALPVFFYGRLTEGGREPAFFRRGGPEELQRRIDAGELQARSRARTAPSDGRGRAHRRPPAAHRLQRQPPLRRRRGRARDRGPGPGAGRRLSRAFARSASTCRGPGSCR